jgi:hypothetical protein
MKILKSIGKYLWSAIKNTIGQVFTLLGLGLAWLALSGEAQVIAGWLCIWGFVIWVISVPFLGGDE